MKQIMVFLCLGFCLSCQHSTTDTEAEKQAITQASNAFSQAYVERNLEEQMHYYTEDAVIIPGSGRMIKGKEAITEYWKIPETVTILEHRSISKGLEVNGHLASDYGIYEGISLRNKDTTVFRGQYVITWRKEEDGQWRMAVDMWGALTQ